MPCGAPMSEEDAISKGADALATRHDLLNNYGLKKRGKTLSPPQKLPDLCLNAKRPFHKRVNLSEHVDPSFICQMESKPSLVLFLFDDDREKVDDDLMRPFLRSCSSNQFRFQADGFSKWFCMDNRVDNGQADMLFKVLKQGWMLLQPFGRFLGIPLPTTRRS